MDKQVILITGGLTGIGRAAALAAARQGHSLVVAGRNGGAGDAIVAELRESGAQAEFVRADVRHEEDVRQLVDATVARFGRLDAAVNTAGTEGTPGPIADQTAESYAQTFDTNVLGTLLSLKHELRVMRSQGSGSIVNVSSTYGHEGAAGASIYAASKHAVEGLTKSAALEAAPHGVRVNAVAPGPTDTGMLDRFALHAVDRKVLSSREVYEKPYLLITSYWGERRDVDLLRLLTKLGTVGGTMDDRDQPWISAKGFHAPNRSNKDRSLGPLENLAFLDADRIPDSYPTIVADAQLERVRDRF